MKNFPGNIFNNISSIRHYIIFNCCYFFLLAFYVFGELYWGDLYDFVFFYFDSPYTDFKLWFPRFHFWVFAVVLILKTGFYFSVASGILFVIKKSITNTEWLSYNKSNGYTGFVISELAIIFSVLLFYLLLYFFSVQYAPHVLHDKLQILIARGFLFHIAFQAIVVLSGNFRKVKGYLKKFFLLPQLPYNIALLRIIFFLYLALIYSGKYRSMLPTVSLKTKVALPYIGWLIEIIPVNASLYSAVVFAGIACCLFIALGFKTRFFLVINALCCFYIIAVPNFFGKLWHEQLVIWITWFFTFSKCYDVFSLDALLNKKAVVKSADYTFPVRFIWLQLGLIYFWAGFYKLWDCGFDWALSKSMINQVQLEWVQNYDKIPAIRIDKFPLLLYVGGLAVILFELGYVLLILKPRIRWIAAGAGLVMHNVIGYFMFIPFTHLLQAFYIFYVDFTRLLAPKNRAFETVKTYSKPTFIFGITIISLNFLCGMFSVDSYPFSSYPKYAALIPDSVKIIQFEALLPDGKKINVHELGRKNKFRWESYGWLEYNLIRDYENGADVSGRVNDYWEIWIKHNPELKQCVHVSAYIVERPLQPEEKNNVKILKKLDYKIE